MVMVRNISELLRRLANKTLRSFLCAIRNCEALYRHAMHKLAWVLTERFWLIDYLPRKPTPNRSVLLVRLDLIGDFIIWLDAAKALRNLYPNNHIVLCGNILWETLASQLPYWDELISVDVSRLRTDDLYRLKVLLRLQQRNFGTAINATYSREYVADMLVRGTNAPVRIGHQGNADNVGTDLKARSDNWYTKLVQRESRDEIELSINAELVRSLGMVDFKSSAPLLPKADVNLTNQLEIAVPYCVLAPGASWMPKAWPRYNYATVAQKFFDEYGLTIVLCGSLSERKLCSEIVSQVSAPIINLCGETTLPQLVELIRNAQFVLANDSAPVHIAVATNTKAVCIVGGGHFGRFLPYKVECDREDQVLPTIVKQELICYFCNWRCPYINNFDTVVPCIDQIPVDRVIASCLDLQIN
jgi:ADP-heptose:LPS heptosyltransferase